MATHLCIDCGNTRVKATLVEGGHVAARAVATLDDWAAVSALVTSRRVDAALLVSTTDGDAALVDALSAQLPCSLERLTAARALPLQVAYRTPHTLGPDRIATAVGAWGEYTGCNLLVVDAGTAITIDVVLAQGTLLGGSISPGVAMRLRAMHEHTSRLPMVEADGEVPLVPYDTTTALRSGAVLGAAAEVDAQAQRLKATLGQLQVVITGGDAELLMPHLLTNGVAHEHDLLAKGADLILSWSNESL
ncbi:MAG: type III pantothenate kinase [Muribaculaceae bacterium]|nr:type III pantothenate kinase [Muribaculaceae bacterium]